MARLNDGSGHIRTGRRQGYASISGHARSDYAKSEQANVANPTQRSTIGQVRVGNCAGCGSTQDLVTKAGSTYYSRHGRNQSSACRRPSCKASGPSAAQPGGNSCCRRCRLLPPHGARREWLFARWSLSSGTKRRPTAL